MNPGLFVMGGGGGGGGKGGKGGKGAGGDQGADGQGGGDGAEGGGNGGGSCGAGSGGGCMNPAHGNAGTQAGDPVDPSSGRVFTIREADLPLTGPLVLALERQYSSSRADLDTGLGFGWSHSFDFSIRRRRRSVVITAPFGKPIVKPLPPGTCEVTVRQLGIFRFDDHSVTMAAESGELFRRFERSPQGRGQFRLSEIFDSAGNVIQLQYHDGLLTGFVDSAGRQGRVQRDGAGRIRRFEVSARGQTTWFRSYEHDARGYLVRIREATGHAT